MVTSIINSLVFSISKYENKKECLRFIKNLLGSINIARNGNTAPIPTTSKNETTIIRNSSHKNCLLLCISTCLHKSYIEAVFLLVKILKKKWFILNLIALENQKESRIFINKFNFIQNIGIFVNTNFIKIILTMKNMTK